MKHVFDFREVRRALTPEERAILEKFLDDIARDLSRKDSER